MDTVEAQAKHTFDLSYWTERVFIIYFLIIVYYLKIIEAHYMCQITDNFLKSYSIIRKQKHLIKNNNRVSLNALKR